MQLRIPLLAAIGPFASIAILFFRAAIGTPMYSARAGRTCDNCHLTPNNWENPRLAERKCSLACQTCHVDPTGGGMRNVSGRFYGRATLPMIATSPRPTSDWDRGPFLVPRLDRATTYSHDLPRGPSNLDETEAYVDSIADFWAYGRTGGEPTPYALYQGRYGTLNATPYVRFGWDLRVAMLLTGTTLIFPMQGDFPISVHPVRHLTLLVNTGFRGRPSGFGNPFEEDRRPYFREAFLLFHEAPYQGYVKLGRFTPAYGLRLDDHTSQIRRRFELDGSLPETRVTGIEVGAAPNYPFVNLSWFGMTSRDRVPHRYNIFDVDDGWGTALHVGYRNLGWSVGGSALLRRRPLNEGGDTSTFGAYAVLNPWSYRANLPLTYQAEFDVGSYKRASGSSADQTAFYEELDWLFANGVNLLITHDWADPDRDVIDDEAHRLAVGVQVTPIPGATLDGRVRWLFPSGGTSDYDFFIQLHLWN